MSDLTTPLLELAARVEGGSGPDRELDAAVHIEVEGWTAREVFGQAGNTFTQYRDAGTLVCVPSHLTSSLDAVKALIERVLPGFEWQVNSKKMGRVNCVSACKFDPVRRGIGVQL